MDLKGREKPWNTQLPVWKKEGGGGIFFYHRQWQKRNECNILHKVHWGRSPVLLWIHSSASGQPSYTVHYCVRLKEEEKKRGGSSGGKENLPLCAGNWKENLCLSEFARESKIFFPPRQLLGASSLVLRDCSFIWVSFSGRQTATPRLLLMMRADVRLVSMNIDVEDSLFHRRTERGKMAAL